MPPGHDDHRVPPRLLKALPPWHPGGWGLPASTLSVAAVLVALAVLGYLQRSSDLRGLFRLPWHPAKIAVPVAALAWVVTLWCRRRPGGLLPRLCTLGVAVTATAVAVWALADAYFVPGVRPFVHALTVAVAFATGLLLMRIPTVRPSSWLLHHLTLLGMLTALVLAFLVTPVLEIQAVGSAVQDMSRYRGELAALTAGVQTNAAAWTGLAEDASAADAQLAALGRQQVPGWLAEPSVWTSAAILNEEAGLTAAALAVTDEVRKSLTSKGAPRLSAPLYSFNPRTRGWETNQAFEHVANTTAGYYRELTRVQDALDAVMKTLGPRGRAPELASRHRSNAEAIAAWKARVQEEWTGRWLIPLTPGGGTSPSLLDTLRLHLPVGPSEMPTRAADLAALMSLPKSDGEQLAERGCARYDYIENSYPYYRYFRVDCQAYTLDAAETRASLQVQLRLVYRAIGNRDIGSRETPYQLYYLFPVPPDAEGGAVGHRQRAMQALFDAVSGLNRPGPWTDKGSLPTEGFWAHANGQTLQVTRPRSVPGLNAIEIQVFAR